VKTPCRVPGSLFPAAETEDYEAAAPGELHSDTEGGGRAVNRHGSAIETSTRREGHAVRGIEPDRQLVASGTTRMLHLLKGPPAEHAGIERGDEQRVLGRESGHEHAGTFRLHPGDRLGQGELFRVAPEIAFQHVEAIRERELVPDPAPNDAVEVGADDRNRHPLDLLEGRFPPTVEQPSFTEHVNTRQQPLPCAVVSDFPQAVQQRVVRSGPEELVRLRSGTGPVDKWVDENLVRQGGKELESLHLVCAANPHGSEKVGGSLLHETGELRGSFVGGTVSVERTEHQHPRATLVQRALLRNDPELLSPWLHARRGTFGSETGP